VGSRRSVKWVLSSPDLLDLRVGYGAMGASFYPAKVAKYVHIPHRPAFLM
jgi:hypothetical protein